MAEEQTNRPAAVAEPAEPAGPETSPPAASAPAPSAVLPPQHWAEVAQVREHGHWL